MLILLSYIIFHVFVGMDHVEDTEMIDIIVRTSMAAIFGYFISNNFMKKDFAVPTQGVDVSNIETISSHQDNNIKNQIGFQISTPPSEEELGKISTSEEIVVERPSYHKVQVIVVSTIGLVSLITMLIIRNYKEMTPELIAIVSQLRDFVSTCVGFLISSGKNTAE